ncbi:hypothetical protein KAJ83_01565 [Marivibrio halodurans]|uniref:Lysozyme n=1 Tax=Marivibrio halodurans TaxID=2039722 RepID=A0A8J7RW80_9PROT|nr:hypothetical protein [Marivibrio halodurans]MBP5855680.1 hypothetical protein [Marivibrio halodurans]
MASQRQTRRRPTDVDLTTSTRTAPTANTRPVRRSVPEADNPLEGLTAGASRIATRMERLGNDLERTFGQMGDGIMDVAEVQRQRDLGQAREAAQEREVEEANQGQMDALMGKTEDDLPKDVSKARMKTFIKTKGTLLADEAATDFKKGPLVEISLSDGPDAIQERARSFVAEQAKGMPEEIKPFFVEGFFRSIQADTRSKELQLHENQKARNVQDFQNSVQVRFSNGEVDDVSDLRRVINEGATITNDPRRGSALAVDALFRAARRSNKPLQNIMRTRRLLTKKDPDDPDYTPLARQFPAMVSRIDQETASVQNTALNDRIDAQLTSAQDALDQGNLSVAYRELLPIRQYRSWHRGVKSAWGDIRDQVAEVSAERKSRSRVASTLMGDTTNMGTLATHEEMKDFAGPMVSDALKANHPSAHQMIRGLSFVPDEVEQMTVGLTDVRAVDDQDMMAQSVVPAFHAMRAIEQSNPRLFADLPDKTTNAYFLMQSLRQDGTSLNQAATTVLTAMDRRGKELNERLNDGYKASFLYTDGQLDDDQTADEKVAEVLGDVVDDKFDATLDVVDGNQDVVGEVTNLAAFLKDASGDRLKSDKAIERAAQKVLARHQKVPGPDGERLVKLTEKQRAFVTSTENALDNTSLFGGDSLWEGAVDTLGEEKPWVFAGADPETMTVDPNTPLAKDGWFAVTGPEGYGGQENGWVTVTPGQSVDFQKVTETRTGPKGTSQSDTVSGSREWAEDPAEFETQIEEVNAELAPLGIQYEKVRNDAEQPIYALHWRPTPPAKPDPGQFEKAQASDELRRRQEKLIDTFQSRMPGRVVNGKVIFNAAAMRFDGEVLALDDPETKSRMADVVGEVVDDFKDKGIVPPSTNVTKLIPDKFDTPQDALDHVLGLHERFVKNYNGGQPVTPEGGDVEDSFQMRAYEYIKAMEGSRDVAYDDPGGNKAVGLGFNLDEPYIREALEEAGANPMDIRQGDAELREDQVQHVFNKAFMEADKILQNKLGMDALFQLPEEARLVLTGMAYQNPALIGDDLTSAIRNGNWRAAEREIREDSNGGDVDLSTRRNAEANMFAQAFGMEPQIIPDSNS